MRWGQPYSVNFEAKIPLKPARRHTANPEKPSLIPSGIGRGRPRSVGGECPSSGTASVDSQTLPFSHTIDYLNAATFVHCCGRGRPMSLGFGGIFFEMSPGGGTASIEEFVWGAQVTLCAWLIGTGLGWPRQAATCHTLK